MIFSYMVHFCNTGGPFVNLGTGIGIGIGIVTGITNAIISS